MNSASLQDAISRVMEESKRQQDDVMSQQRAERERINREQEEQRRQQQSMRASQPYQAQQMGLGDGGMNPQIISQFMGGGGGGAAQGGLYGNAATGAAQGGLYGNAATGGVAGGGGASGAGGGIAAAGPWAALAAAIIGNEAAAKDAGRRPDSKSKWGTELLTGKVLERDMDYYGDKVGGIGGQAIKGLGQMGNPEGALRFIKNLF